eukprot:gene4765-5827_t
MSSGVKTTSYHINSQALLDRQKESYEAKLASTTDLLESDKKLALENQAALYQRKIAELESLINENATQHAAVAAEKERLERAMPSVELLQGDLRSKAITERANELTDDIDRCTELSFCRLIRCVDAQIFSGYRQYMGVSDEEVQQMIGAIAHIAAEAAERLCDPDRPDRTGWASGSNIASAGDSAIILSGAGTSDGGSACLCFFEPSEAALVAGAGDGAGDGGSACLCFFEPSEAALVADAGDGAGDGESACLCFFEPSEAALVAGAGDGAGDGENACLCFFEPSEAALVAVCLVTSSFNNRLKASGYTPIFKYSIAGGDAALFRSVEQAEDDPATAVDDLKATRGVLRGWTSAADSREKIVRRLVRMTGGAKGVHVDSGMLRSPCGDWAGDKVA